MNNFSSSSVAQNPEEAWVNIVKTHERLNKAISSKIGKNSNSKLDQEIAKLSGNISGTVPPSKTPPRLKRLKRAKLDKIITKLSDNLVNNESILVEKSAQNIHEHLLENLSAEVEKLRPSEKKIQEQFTKIMVKAYDKCMGTEDEGLLRKDISDRMEKDPQYAIGLLAQAIHYDAFKLVRVLVELGTDIFSSLPSGLKCGPHLLEGISFINLAILLSKNNEDSSLIDAFRAGGWNPNKKDFSGMVGLIYAITYNANDALIKKILSLGADINSPLDNGRTPLHEAVFYDTPPRIIQLLVKNGANIEAQDSEGFTPLGVAIRYDNVSGLSELLDAGANPNVRFKNGDTPLIEVLRCIKKYDAPDKKRNAINMFEILIEKADVNWTNEIGRSPLHMAVALDLHAYIPRLVQQGADLKARSGDKTPLVAAVNDKKEEAVLALLEAGADPNLPGRLGWTPLHHAATSDSSAIIKLLLEKGANLEAYTAIGETPLEKAIAGRKELATATLKSLGADAQYAINALKTKFMANIWGIGSPFGLGNFGIGGKFSIQGKKISHPKRPVEGHYQRQVPPLFHSYLTEFFNMIGDTEPTLTPAAKRFILKAFKNAYPDKTETALEKIVAANRSNEPCLILGGSIDHNISMTVTSSLLSVSNRGWGLWNQQEATDVFELPKHMQTYELVEFFEKLMKEYASVKEFYKMLHSLNLKRDMGIRHKNQKVGNCSTANTKAALMFLFVLIANGDVKEGKRLYKQFTSYLRERTLSDYEQLPAPNSVLLKKIHAKQARKAAKKQKTSMFASREKLTPYHQHHFLGYNTHYLSSDYHIHRDPLSEKRPDQKWKNIAKIDALLEKATGDGLKKSKLDEVISELEKNILAIEVLKEEDLAKNMSYVKVLVNIQENISKLILGEKGQLIIDSISKILLKGYDKYIEANGDPEDLRNNIPDFPKVAPQLMREAKRNHLQHLVQGLKKLGVTRRGIKNTKIPPFS